MDRDGTRQSVPTIEPGPGGAPERAADADKITEVQLADGSGDHLHGEVHGNLRVDPHSDDDLDGVDLSDVPTSEDDSLAALLGGIAAAPAAPPPVELLPGMQLGAYRIVRRVGAGGAGIVYEVVDTVGGETLALKTLRLRTPELLLRFKHEFRALQDVHHPNLVMLGDLMEVGGVWFFTMELVDGVDFLSYVRPDDDAIDPVRLRGALGQLADAVAALHAASKVHRDLKPSNVLVTRTGRVVVLDFGLIADIVDGDPLSDDLTVGTAHYMAPEQATAAAIGPAADWYSVGAMLHEALTGRLPITGSPVEILLAKRLRPAPELGDLVRQHGAIGQLCADLMRGDAEARAGLAAIRLELRDPAAVEPVVSDEPAIEQPPFVGRRHELAALDAVFERVRAGHAAVVLVEGDSGIGKSALVRQFLADTARAATVLAGRCYERELVPFKAVDGLVDALSGHLRRLPEAAIDALLPADADLLSRVFPVLARIPAIARRPAMSQALDATEIRARVFAALHQLLTRLAGTGTLVLFIDDLQWSDTDSLVLLEHIARGPTAVPALVILTTRPGWAAPPWLADAPATALRLTGLERGDAEELRRRLVSLWRGPRVDVRIDDAGGHPLLLAELVRHAIASDGANQGHGLDLADALWARVTRLDADSRALLEIIAIAGAAVPPELAVAAAGLGGSGVARSQAVLRSNFLVRHGAGGQTVDTYHDVVRELVRARLPEPARRARHRALAETAQGHAAIGPDMLALHWHEAGEPAQAARWARLGGERALAQLAFDHAARLFQLALEHTDPDPAERRYLLEALGQSLAHAGRGRQAATRYLAAAELVDGSPTIDLAGKADGGGREPVPVSSIELRRKAAEQFLLSGYVDDGRAVLTQVVAATGLRMPTSELRALGMLLWRRLRLTLRGRGWRPRVDIDPAELTRIDVCYAAASGLVAIDPLRSSFFLSQQLLLALRAGDPMRVGRALAFDISFLAATRGPDHPAFHAAWERAQAVATPLGDPRVQALIDGNAGAAALLGGRFDESVELCGRAERTVRARCVGFTWELDVIELVSLTAQWYLGRLGEMVREVPRRLREAGERGDRFSATNLRTGVPFAAWLITDDIAGAEHELATARGEWSQEDFYVQHAQMLHADVLLALYRGQARHAQALLTAAAPLMGRTLLNQILLHRVMMADLHGRTALALAQVAGLDARSRRKHLAAARRHARTLGREKVPWARALAALLTAEIIAHDGDRDRAIAAMERAEATLRSCAMAFHAQVARRRRGQLLGDAGAPLVAEADAWLRTERVARPAELASILAPGSTPDRWT